MLDACNHLFDDDRTAFFGGQFECGSNCISIVQIDRYAPPVISVVDEAALRAGFSVKHDDPYRGGFTTRNYGRPSNRVHAVQVEIARRLYMDEEELRLTDGASRVVAFAGDLVRSLGGVEAHS